MRRAQPEHRGVEPRTAHGSRSDELVVLLEDPALGLELARCAATAPRRSARLLLDLVARALVGEKARGYLSDAVVVVERVQRAAVGDLADDGARQLPARAHLAHRVEHLRSHGRDHPLLRLRDHDLPRLHALLALRHAVEVDVDAGAVRGHLGERRRKARGAAVLQRLDESPLDELDTRLDQLLAGERVADLHRRTLVRVLLAELLAREHRCAADAVAAGRRAVEHDEMTGDARLRTGHAVAGKDPHAHRVDEAVVRVRPVEDSLAADRRNARRCFRTPRFRRRRGRNDGRARRSAARRGARSAARPWRRCRAGSRRCRSPPPGTARRRTDGCATRP